MRSAAVVAEPVLHWIAGAVIVAAVPHMPGLPLWISALIVTAIALRLGMGRPPPRWLLVPVVMTVFAAVLLQYRTLSGADAGGAFFAAMVALKFLETRDRRDAGLLVCLTYFLATSVFLTNQSIAMSGYVLASIALTTVALITLAAPTGPPVTLRVRRAVALLVQALPIMLVLFLLFPRISGPLWGIGDEPESARTGLDDSMSPGSISQLMISSEVAFRAQFDGAIPPPSQRYWRGPVLWQFDGRTWTRGEPRVRGAPVIEPLGEPVEYALILQPSGRHWVLGLDLPVAPPDGIHLTRGQNLVSRQRVNNVTYYRLQSISDYRMEPDLPPDRRLRGLEIPAGVAPRARALARRWASRAAGPQAVVDRALRLFREQEFYYTLTPPRLTGDPVDEFLFESRRGFCEHYAGAFVFLMRAAGVPARVVTGYQGGAVNELGDYVIVRQSDAHAWAEVWLPERGWVRVDPTGVVSPDRIEGGIGNVAGADETLDGLSRPGRGAWRELALAWDSINHGWNRLVVGYGPELQQRLLRHIGLEALGRYALSLVMIVAAVGMLAAVWLLANRLQPDADPVVRQWRRTLARLRHAGLDPRTTEGPTALARRVARRRPDLAPRLGRIVRLYNRLRYAPRASPGDLERLQREVARFRPSRRARGQDESAGTASAGAPRASKR